MNKRLEIQVTEPSKGYELLDSGENEKLERWGDVVLSRPDPQALWKKRLDPKEWKKANAYFTRDADSAEWNFKNADAKGNRWQIEHGGLQFWIKPTAFKHTGLFPEQSTNWEWLGEKILAKRGATPGGDEAQSDLEVLNLFGYTGGASLACAKAGAKVVHIDSSKAAVTWAKENAEISDLSEKPIRWIVEDVRIFVEREIKRGRKYDGIIMDPPSFGHGPDSELWKIEEHFLALLENCKLLLKEKPLFFLINGYSAGYSAMAYENNLLDLKEKFGGEIEVGELAIKEGGENARLLPAGIFARWSAK